MLKSKLMFGLIATMVVLALAPSSFAQINITIFPNATPQEISNNLTAETADPLSAGAGIVVSGSLVANSPLTTTLLTITYPASITSAPLPGAIVAVVPGAVVDGITPVPATSSTLAGGGYPATDIPSGDGIRIVGATGVFSAAAIWTVNFSAGTLTIRLQGTNDQCGAGCQATNTQTGSFRIVGVRVNGNALSGAGPFNANFAINNSANNYILSTSSGTVISATVAGFTMDANSRTSTSPALGTQGTATLFTNRIIADGVFTTTLREGGLFVWRSAAQNAIDNAAAAGSFNSTQIRFTFTGVPTGVTLTPAVVSSSSGTTPAVGAAIAAVTSASNTTVVNVAGGSTTSADAFQIDWTVTVAANASLSPSSITVTATVAPIGAAFNSTGFPTAADGYPKHAAVEIGPLTVVNIIATNTTMLIPFVVKDLGFDTGIAIANTTADPFGGAVNGGATPTAGTLVLSIFPRSATGGAGTSFTLTTSSSVKPGVGLSSDGTLAAGATWTVLLSEVMTSASQTGSLTGYMFIVGNSLNLHGSSFVTDFRAFTSYSPVLILPPPQTSSRSNPGVQLAAGAASGVESLNN